jgi:hypothetical protein
LQILLAKSIYWNRYRYNRKTEIKNPSSDMQQLSIDVLLTNVTNSVNFNIKTGKTTDIAIGDFIVAMDMLAKLSSRCSTNSNYKHYYHQA